MSQDIYKIIIPVIIALLIIWLIYRIKNKVKLAVKNEIFNNFPSIKHTIENFERRLDYLKTQAEALERKIGELKDKSK